jgi:hypothetical protein
LVCFIVLTLFISNRQFNYKIGDKGAIELAEALKVNTKLKTIDILIKKFTLYKDIEHLYNFDRTYFENIGYNIVEHIIEKYNCN